MRKLAQRSIVIASALAAVAAITAPAMAADGEGKLQVKVLGSAVLPDGKIDKVKFDAIGIPANTQTKADDNFVPTLAIEYFFTPNISLETICCLTQHDVTGTRGLPGAELVSNAKLIPATFTLKYHLDAGGIKPYVGAGPTYFMWFNEKSGKATKALGADKFDMSNEIGLALQGGVDIPVNDNGMAISLDAKRYFVKTSAKWYANGTKVLATKHKVDPWVLSAGLAFRF